MPDDVRPGELTVEDAETLTELLAWFRRSKTSPGNQARAAGLEVRATPPVDLVRLDPDNATPDSEGLYPGFLYRYDMATSQDLGSGQPHIRQCGPCKIEVLDGTQFTRRVGFDPNGVPVYVMLDTSGGIGGGGRTADQLDPTDPRYNPNGTYLGFDEFLRVVEGDDGQLYLQLWKQDRWLQTIDGLLTFASGEEVFIGILGCVWCPQYPCNPTEAGTGGDLTSGGGILTQCSSLPIATTLTVTVTNKTGTCTCLPNTFTLTYQSGSLWSGAAIGCSGDGLFYLNCAGSQWIIYAAGNCTMTPSGPDGGASNMPLTFSNKNITGCCTGTATFTISE